MRLYIYICILTFETAVSKHVDERQKVDQTKVRSSTKKKKERKFVNSRVRELNWNCQFCSPVCVSNKYAMVLRTSKISMFFFRKFFRLERVFLITFAKIWVCTSIGCSSFVATIGRKKKNAFRSGNFFTIGSKILHLYLNWKKNENTGKKCKKGKEATVTVDFWTITPFYRHAIRNDDSRHNFTRSLLQPIYTRISLSLSLPLFRLKYEGWINLSYIRPSIRNYRGEEPAFDVQQTPVCRCNYINLFRCEYFSSEQLLTDRDVRMGERSVGSIEEWFQRE